MKLTPVDIDVKERNDEVVRLTLTLRRTTGVLEPYDLTNVPLEMYVKRSTNDADEDAVITYTTVDERLVVTDALAGKLDIRFNASDLESPGQYVYRVDSVANGARNTLVIGTLTVHNV